MTDTRQTVTAEITNALMDLMTEKPFVDITVTDVVKKAKVGRASFYRNFSSTNEVLDRIFNEFVMVFKENALPVITSQDERKWRAFLFRYIYFVNDHQRKLILSRNSNVALILSRLSEVARELSQTLQFSNLREKYAISSRVGVINSVIVRWIADGRIETPEEIVDYLMSFILTI